jgi:hypothetical protein
MVLLLHEVFHTCRLPMHIPSPVFGQIFWMLNWTQGSGLAIWLNLGLNTPEHVQRSGSHSNLSQNEQKWTIYLFWHWSQHYSCKTWLIWLCWARYSCALDQERQEGWYSVMALSGCKKVTIMIDPPPAPEKQEVEVLSAMEKACHCPLCMCQILTNFCWVNKCHFPAKLKHAATHNYSSTCHSHQVYIAWSVTTKCKYPSHAITDLQMSCSSYQPTWIANISY